MRRCTVALANLASLTAGPGKLDATIEAAAEQSGLPSKPASDNQKVEQGRGVGSLRRHNS